MGGFASQMMKSIEEEYCFDEKYKNRTAIKPLSEYSTCQRILPRVVYDDDSMLRRRMMVKEFRSQRSAVVKLPPINSSQKHHKVKTTKSEGSINENDLDETILENLQHPNCFGPVNQLHNTNRNTSSTDNTVYYFG
ncbi:predicted protein [Naegleria gruberi]|uniref:Predicted protein n=1 Tax=Naegleria gruberi TaxID=5762 RepID=D2UY99_NAEGR|nr:uncharacterized protein NAEGRDRAFT_45126 [Naegleria gruberi]EFC50758.1 predicted protein [Naegleria gruberi]|eukprot:XP_002683502.1 predicted protein [Naegleria gruberi strain NEG-M]